MKRTLFHSIGRWAVRVGMILLVMWSALVFLISFLNDAPYRAWTADTEDIRNPLQRRIAGIAAGVLLLILCLTLLARLRAQRRRNGWVFYAVLATGTLLWPLLYRWLPNQYAV